MCVYDIVSFVDDYVSGNIYANCGEFYYDEDTEIKNFSINLVNAFYEKFKNNCTVLETYEKSILVKIRNTKFECVLEEIEMVSLDDVFSGYSWSAIPICEY